MSSFITGSQVRRQLAAMACGYFDIGILRPDGRMLFCEAYTFSQIEQAIQPLRRENARGAHIFVRPHGAHTLNLVDDLGVDAIARMTDAGFQPALVVETSPQNFQVWLNHGRTLDRSMSSCAAKELAKRFGGDLSSADWRHFGRLAGFTNRKLERLLPNGLAPFVRLHDCQGKTYDTAREFLKAVKSLIEKAAAERASRTTSGAPSAENSIRPLAEFHSNPRYVGDLHRADMAWALHAASRGLSEQRIRGEILQARDLSKKGRIQRQVDYAERTAIKAVTTVQPGVIHRIGPARI
ncbi:MAG: DNA-primase RepB domain-containing protein [Candidatus Binatus sp.]|uniref:DNA-primase RepB domain-containing protein n=1 Tax=Candidatus Binatus sp. TaxID=2811406 RepID=UPI003C709B97